MYNRSKRTRLSSRLSIHLAFLVVYKLSSSRFSFFVIFFVNLLILFSSVYYCLLTVRLAGSGLKYEGRLEVFYSGIWGTVCDDSFDNVDATVACKSLGSGLIHYFALILYEVRERTLTFDTYLIDLKNSHAFCR